MKTCSAFLLPHLIFLFDLPESSPGLHNSRWRLCTLIGVAGGDKGLTISPIEVIMGRTINGTSFGGQFFFPLNFLHSSTTHILTVKIIQKKGKQLV